MPRAKVRDLSFDFLEMLCTMALTALGSPLRINCSISWLMANQDVGSSVVATQEVFDCHFGLVVAPCKGFFDNKLALVGRFHIVRRTAEVAKGTLCGSTRVRNFNNALSLDERCTV